MARQISSVHVDIARLSYEVSEVSMESTENPDMRLGAWLRQLVRCLATRNPAIHPYGAFLLSEVEEYRKFDSERKKAKFSKDSTESRNGLPRTEQNRTEQSSKEEKKKKSVSGQSRFVPPTVENVRAYCAERKNSVDPEKWWHHYDSNGWMVGKNKMQKWKSAVITWEKNGNHTGTSQRGFAGTSTQPQVGAQERRTGKAGREFTESLSL